jgi:hypothetical protein
MKAWLKGAGRVAFGAFLGALVATAVFAPLGALATGWSAPTTFSANQTLTAALMNTYVRDNTLHLKELVDKAPQILVSNTTAVGNITTGEDDLITYSLPANTLATNGDVFIFRAVGTTGSNGNAKIVRCKFGGQELITSNPGFTFNGAQSWAVEATIFRTGAATQYAMTRLWSAAADRVQVTSSSPTETLSGAITVKCTGEAIDTDDVRQTALHGQKWPAP